MRRLFPILWVLFLGFTAMDTACAAVSPAQKTIESFFSTLRSMKFPVQDQDKHASLVAQAHAALDLESMGKAALGAHFDQANPGERKAFFEIFWQLIEWVAYPKSSRFIGNFQITYPEVKDVSGGAEVHSVIKQEEQALDVKVVYRLYEKDGVWKIHDIILDDVSIIEDLHFQFDTIVKESRFAGLLQKMKDRLSQAVQENGTIASR